eukprot:gene9357-23881_t
MTPAPRATCASRTPHTAIGEARRCSAAKRDATGTARRHTRAPPRAAALTLVAAAAPGVVPARPFTRSVQDIELE